MLADVAEGLPHVLLGQVERHPLPEEEGLLGGVVAGGPEFLEGVVPAEIHWNERDVGGVDACTVEARDFQLLIASLVQLEDGRSVSLELTVGPGVVTRPQQDELIHVAQDTPDDPVDVECPGHHEVTVALPPLIGDPGITEVRTAHLVLHPEWQEDEPQSEGGGVRHAVGQPSTRHVFPHVEDVHRPPRVDDLDHRLGHSQSFADDHLLVADDEETDHRQGEEGDLEHQEDHEREESQRSLLRRGENCSAYRDLLSDQHADRRRGARPSWATDSNRRL